GGPQKVSELVVTPEREDPVAKTHAFGLQRFGRCSSRNSDIDQPARDRVDASLLLVLAAARLQEQRQLPADCRSLQSRVEPVGNEAAEQARGMRGDDRPTRGRETERALVSVEGIGVSRNTRELEGPRRSLGAALEEVEDGACQNVAVPEGQEPVCVARHSEVAG